MKIRGMNVSSFVIRTILFPAVLPILILAAIGHHCGLAFDWLDNKIPK